MSEAELPTSGGFWASVGAIALTLAGGAGVAVKAWFNRNRTAAATEKTEAETDLANAKAEATAVGTATDLLAKVYDDNDRVRAENARILTKLDESEAKHQKCEADRNDLRTLVDKQAREIGRHTAAFAHQGYVIDQLTTRMGKLETALTMLGKDPKLVS